MKCSLPESKEVTSPRPRSKHSKFWENFDYNRVFSSSSDYYQIIITIIIIAIIIIIIVYIANLLIRSAKIGCLYTLFSWSVLKWI